MANEKHGFLKELALELLFNGIKSAGIFELTQVLALVRKKLNDDAKFAETLKKIYATFNLLLDCAEATKTKIDDGFIETILAAVKQVASDNGIAL